MAGLGVTRRAEQRVVRHIQPLSAARVTFALGLSVVAILLVGLVALYLLGLASGALGSVEDFVAGYIWPDFHMGLFPVVAFVVIGGVVGCGLAALGAVVLAALYNALAELVGGLEIVTRER